MASAMVSWSEAVLASSVCALALFDLFMVHSGYSTFSDPGSEVSRVFDSVALPVGCLKIRNKSSWCFPHNELRLNGAESVEMGGSDARVTAQWVPPPLIMGNLPITFQLI